MKRFPVPGGPCAVLPASLGVCLALALLAGCGSKPRQPDWQMDAHGATERFVAAALEGNARVEAADFERARRDVAATGRIDLIARVELTRCATRVASLVFEPCTGFEALREDAPPAERAYADYLGGRLAAGEAALLPPQHRGVAGGAAGVAGIADPFARLVAAGVLFQSGRASPAVIAAAIETASAQGWRRPLLAWLGVQRERAAAAGASADAARIQRRMDLIIGPGGPAPAAPR